MSPEKDKLPEAKEVKELFPFQLADVRLFEVHAEHCPAGNEKPEDAVFGFSLKHSVEPPEAKEFGILLTFEGKISGGEKDACKMRVGVEGTFITTVDPSLLKTDVIERFRRLDAAVLLWPYLRQYVNDLTNRMGLGLPPLPTLDVRAILLSGKKNVQPPAVEATPVKTVEAGPKNRKKPE